MTCAEFVEGHTDFLDGLGSEAFNQAAEEHLRSCARCRRYDQVVRRGREVLRGLPPAEVPADFRPRLQHRLYHVEEEMAAAAHLGSGATVSAVLGISVLLVAAAWSPALRPSAPRVELAPIVVSSPPPRSPLFRPLNALPSGSVPVRSYLRPAFSESDGDLWNDAQRLLHEYSPLQQRYRQGSTRRSGVEDG